MASRRFVTVRFVATHFSNYVVDFVNCVLSSEVFIIFRIHVAIVIDLKVATKHCTNLVFSCHDLPVIRLNAKTKFFAQRFADCVFNVIVIEVVWQLDVILFRKTLFLAVDLAASLFVDEVPLDVIHVNCHLFSP